MLSSNDDEQFAQYLSSTLAAMPRNDRNEAYEFAVRTRRNLVAIEKSKTELHGEPVHVVVQLTNSLLGLIVFPKEKEVFNRAKEKTVDAMSMRAGLSRESPWTPLRRAIIYLTTPPS